MLVFLKIRTYILFFHPFIISGWYLIQSDGFNYPLRAGNSQLGIISPDIPPMFQTLNIFVNIKGHTLIILTTYDFVPPHFLRMLSFKKSQFSAP